MSYNTLEKRRLEEYQRNLKLVGTNKSSIDTSTNNRNILPIFQNENNSNFRNKMNGVDLLKMAEIDNNRYFKRSSVLNDGYQFGDISKAVGSTVADLGLNLVKGVTGIGESAGKLVAGGIAQVADFAGKDEYAQRVRNNIAGKNNKVNKMLITSQLNNINDLVENQSTLGKKSDELTTSLGYLAGQVGLQAVGVPWQVTAGVSSAGNELQNAYANGAKDWEAWLSAGISAGFEIGSEYLSGGVKLPGTGKATETLIGSATEKIKNKALKYAVELAVETGGEGLEEVISGFGSALGQKITYMSDKKLKEIYSSEDALDDFVAGTLVSFVANSVNPKTYQDIKTGRSLITGNTIEEAKIIGLIDKSIKNKKIIDNNNLTTSEKKIATNYLFNQISNLEAKNKLTKSQEIELNNLKEQLNAIQNQNNDTSTSSKAEVNLPTVQDIVNQEKSSQNSVNLPVYNQQSNITNSDKAILPTVNDFNSSNINMPTSNIKIDMTKIKPEILEDIKGFKLGDPSIESYKGSYIKTMLNEVGIKVPNAMNYVSEVRPDMSFTTTKDLTRQQYSSISNALQKLRSIDVTSVNNTNTALAPVDMPQIKQIKGNIPINQELLNKYANVKEIFANEKNNYDGNINVSDTINELENIDIANMTNTEIYHKAVEIFNNHHNTNKFINDNNKIIVSNTDIKESINKINNNSLQKKYLKEHLLIFSDLGDIIEKSSLVNQTFENKNRGSNKIWSYYLNGLNINNSKFLFEFDVISKENGENHYRVQRLEKIEKKQTSPSEGADFGTNSNLAISAFSDDNIPQSNEKVKSSILPITNNMQNNGNNTINMPPLESKKLMNPNEISKLTKEDANTTPLLPKRGSINKVNDGNSHFAKNIKDKVNMLNADQKIEILSKEDVRYYDKVTNKESLEKVFKQINDGGSSEILRWIKQDSKNASATDVAEGWILLKQYADNGDYDSMVEVAKKMREIGTSAGQTVQAFNIMERMTPEGMVKYAQSELSEAYDRMVKNKSKEWIDKYREDFDLKPDEVKFIMETMQEVQNMEDGYDKRVKLAEIQKLMTDKLPPEKGAKIKSWMRISMLFNPKTQVRNVAGNALIMPINSFGDLFSSYADKIIAKKTGIRTTGTTNIKAILKGMKKGAYESTNDFKKGISTRDMEGNRFEITNGKSFSEKNLIGKTLNRTESLLNYVMDVGDRVFSEAAFENSLQNQMVLNNTTEITQEMIDIAHQEALSRTWNDNNNYTKFVLGVRKGLNKLNINGYGLGDVLIPFAKTPANLTKAIVDYSPAGLVSTISKGINLKRSLTNGQYTATMQHEFVQSLGKATAGTMLYVLGIALAKAGITSGDSDDDKDTANFLKNTLGINSYSIKIGGKSFTYDWAQPLAAPLSITANVVNSKNSDSKALLEGIVGSLDSAGSILLEQSFLQSINDVLNDNDGVVSGIINEILELPARAIPTFSKQIADLVDGTQRTSFEYGKPIQSAVNSIKAKIPFVSKTLNPTVDTMGREIQKYGGKNNIFNVFLNPANVSTENISESAEEIYRLYKETGETDVMPRVAPYYINQKGEKIMMTGKDRVEYQKISGEIIEDNIKKLINNASYSSMSDSDKANVVKDIVNYSYNIAKKDVLGLELSNTYQKAYEYSEIGDIGDYYTFKESIDNTDKDTKKASITKFLIDSDLTNEQLAYLYGNYYSSDKVLNALVQSNIPIKEYIKFNSETFESDYYTNGKTVPNSRKNKVIKYINSLNLSISQKAMLIKMEYSSFKQYDNQIVKYVNNIDCSSYDKKVILKTIGFTSYDKDIINTINSKNISVEEKTKELEELGFKVRNGRVYTK